MMNTDPSNANVGGEVVVLREGSLSNQPTNNGDAQSSSFTDDFICISEFSEIVGPVPLFCFPEKGYGNFNLEKFVIRIMAVDYNQNKAQDAGTFMEDTQVVISEASEDAHAYVHHFSLLDVYARGYVRPICMSYITRHPSKIMENFSDILERFLKISMLFKKTNQVVFLRDMEQRMADLYFTRDTLQKPASPPTPSTPKGDDASSASSDAAQADPSLDGISAEDAAKDEAAKAAAIRNLSFDPTCQLAVPTTGVVNESIREMKAIRDRLRNNILRKAKDDPNNLGIFACHNNQQSSGSTRHPSRKSRGSRKRDNTDIPEEEDDEDKEIYPSNTSDDDAAEGKAGEEDSSQWDDEGGDSLRDETDQEDKNDDEHGIAKRVESRDFGSNTELEGLEGPDMPEGAEEEEELSDAPEVDVDLEEDRGIPEALNEIYKKLGVDMTDYQPKLVNTLYKGRRYDAKLRELNELCAEGFSRAWKKINELRAHYSREPIILTLENEELSLLDPSSSLLTMGHNVLCNFSLDAYIHAPVRMHRKRTPSQSQLSYGGASDVWLTPLDSISPISSPGSSPDTSSFSSVEEYGSPPSHRIWMAGESFTDDIDKFLGLDGNHPPPHVMVCPPSPNTVEEQVTEEQHQSAHKLTHKKLGVECWAAILFDHSPNESGKGIKQLLSYSFVRHLLFSLLKGRPTVISAHTNHEEAVTKLIKACALFVPGHVGKSTSAITNWRTTPLSMSDMAHVKLVGLSKSTPIPNTVKRYISVWDYEAGTLTCPPYENGTFIDRILGTKNPKGWPDESTHLAYIHCKLLELGIQACLYYHICCISSNNIYSTPTSPSITPTSSAVYSNNSSGGIRTYAQLLFGNQGGGIAPQPPSQRPTQSKSAHATRNVSSSHSTLPPLVHSSNSADTAAPPRRHTRVGHVESRLSERDYRATQPISVGGYSGPVGGLGIGASAATSASNAAPGSAGNRRFYYSDSHLPHLWLPPAVPAKQREQAKASFTKQMNAKSSDMAIIEYFAEVVKEQQSAAMQGLTKVVPVIRLDYTPCVVHSHVETNRKKKKSLSTMARAL